MSDAQRDRAVAELGSRLAVVERRLHGLETAPRAPFTQQIIDQQAEILAAAQNATAAAADAAQAAADAASAVARVDAKIATLTFSPGSQTDTSAASGWSTWLTVGSVTRPSWATSAYIVSSIGLVIQQGAVDTFVQLRVQIGSTNFLPITITGRDDASPTVNPTWGTRAAFSASGAQTVRIQSEPINSGQLRATTSTVVGLSIFWI